jgi:hypothetical protein
MLGSRMMVWCDVAVRVADGAAELWLWLRGSSIAAERYGNMVCHVLVVCSTRSTCACVCGCWQDMEHAAGYGTCATRRWAIKLRCHSPQRSCMQACRFVHDHCL